MSLRSAGLSASAYGLLLLVACAPSLPGPGEAGPVAARPDTLWVPPKHEPPARAAARPRALPEGIADRRTALTLEDVVALALEGSPDSREAWANARARAAAYGAARGDWFPEIRGDFDATRLKTSATQGRSAVQQTIYEPSVSFTWLLMDIGGRSGNIRSNREALIAANWTHNATLQDVVLRAAGAYFDYAAARALLTAQQTTLTEAEANLAAAEERRRVGVATIADVLQARTAVGQARLDLQAVEGDVQTTRGALAVATGFPANLEYDIDTTIVNRNIADVAEDVDSLIGIAIERRPDLASARADYESARADISVAGAQRLPSLVASGNFGRTYRSGVSGGSDAYSLSVGLRIPLFNGFTWEYNREAARALAEAARARAQSLEQQVIFQVFSAYYALRTATVRTGTADALLASATESAEAARGRYQAGVGSLLELLNAENALATARAQRIQARLAWQAALVQLAHDAGLLDLQGKSPLRLMPVNVSPDSLP
jgi:outer membrane protein TolC